MAITKGAKKAIRVSTRKRVFNDRRRDAMRDNVKELTRLIRLGDKKGAEAKLPEVYKAIDKATKAGVIKPNTAARKKSRLVVAIKRIK